MTISTETQEKAKQIIWKGLNFHFNGKVRFADVHASAMLDQDQDEFLNVLVVYEGDRKNLEPRLCNSLYQEIRGQLFDIGLYTVPSISYVDKADGKKRIGTTPAHGPIRQT